MQTTVSPYRQAYRSPNSPDGQRWNRGGVIYENRRDRQSSYISPYFWGSPYGLGYYGDNGFYGDGYGADYDQSYDQNYGSDPYSPDQYNGFDPQGAGPEEMQGSYRIQGQDQYGDQAEVQGPYPGQYPNQIPPGAPYQPAYNSPYAASNGGPGPRPVYHPSQSVPNQPAVTLVFKDNRPNQIIHNYLINGGTLTVWDQYAHDIPVEDINVEATRKINRDKGVDFILPNASL
jgi:hypothetical protein